MLRRAVLSDAGHLAALINAAFVVEQPIFGGDRTNTDAVHALLDRGHFLVLEESNRLVGCVFVEVRGKRGYVGLLSVEPSRQGSGLGRTLMAAAEQYFGQAHCKVIDLRVMSARTPLPGFYEHLGYEETHRSELPAQTRPKVPCCYIHMSKRLK